MDGYNSNFVTGGYTCVACGVGVTLNTLHNCNNILNQGHVTVTSPTYTVPVPTPVDLRPQTVTASKIPLEGSILITLGGHTAKISKEQAIALRDALTKAI